MSKFRKKCLERGHMFDAAYPGAPIVFCRRWLCMAEAVSVFTPSRFAVDLHNAIPEDVRFPPVEFNNDGSVKRVL